MNLISDIKNRLGDGRRVLLLAAILGTARRTFRRGDAANSTERAFLRSGTTLHLLLIYLTVNLAIKVFIASNSSAGNVDTRGRHLRRSDRSLRVCLGTNRDDEPGVS